METHTFSDTSGLSAEEFELLAYLLEDEGVKLNQQQTIFPRRQHDDLPLSFAQQRLWFLDQLEPGNTAYNLPFAIRVVGRLDASVLRRSLNEIVRRHEVLRTTFPAIEGQPIQLIAPALALDLQLIDLRALPAAEHEAQIERLARSAAQKPFALARGPLIAAKLLRLAAAEHVVVLIIHHIAFDGWSTGVFLQEVIALYDAFSSGQPSPLPALSIQYADFAIWQRQWLQGELLAQQLAYWRRQLRGSGSRMGAPMLDLPLDRPRPLRQTHQGARMFHSLPSALADSLAALSQRESATLFMTLLAAFGILLYRYSGQDDIVVGTPIANRDFVELERLVGFFVNTLLLRADLSGAPGFGELLARVREMMFGAYAHQNIPFEQIVHELQPERNLSRNPLFQVMFILQNASTPEYHRPDLSITFLSIENETTMFDLMLTINETPAGLSAMLTYATDLFDAATMRRMLGHYQVLLEGIVAAPDRPIARLPLLTEPERRQLLVDWNDRTTEVRSQESGVRSSEFEARLLNPDSWLLNTTNCIHELFEAQAARTPDVIVCLMMSGDPTNDERRTTNGAEPSSIVYRPSSIVHLTYRELNARANRLARYLRAQGVGAETLVALCIERSPELLIGMLGVLKAGGAYLPLDPVYPAERLEFMLRDSRASVLVTNSDAQRAPGMTNDQIDHLVTLSPCHLVRLDADWPMITQMPAEPPHCGVTASNLAYVIYTSGSVGAPKGVQVSHRALVNYIAAAAERFAITSDDRVLQFASTSFDTAAEEIYACLSRGATLVLRSDALLGSAALFAQACYAHGLTVIDLPTAYWHQLTAELAAQSLRLPASLRLTIIGGEPALPDRAALWRQCASDRARLVNTYGPTEATIAATHWELPGRDNADELYSVPIGRSIENALLYVLDAGLDPVPIGIAGELYIGGAGVARGYLGRPDLTAERFVPNPFARVSGVGYRVSEDTAPNTRHPIPDTRLYKTGDLVRYRAGGEIEFLGRADQQLKIRGFRVEPGEIETVLQRHPAIRSVAVVARDVAPGDTRLVAYVVPTEGTGVPRSTSDDKGRRTNDESESSSFVVRPSSTAAELRSFMAEHLPDYMIPSAVVTLGALPLTPSGKVDRQALPAPDWSRRVHDQTYVAPRTPLEAMVADLAAQVLGVERVGVHDNFFDLGGHSLLIVRLLSRIQKQFGQELVLATLFQNPTVEHLARTLRQHADAPPTPLVGIQPGGSKRPFFCVHPGAGGVLCYVDLAHCLGAAQPFYALQAAGLEDDQPPRTRVEEMAAAYLAALRAVQPEGPYLLGGWSFGGLVAFEIAQQLRAQGQEVALLALFDSWTPRAETAPPSDDVTLLAWFAHDLGRMFGKTPQLSIEDLRRIEPELRLRFVIEQASAENLLPPDIGEQQIRRGLQVFAANQQAMVHYRPRPYAGRVALFRASEHPVADLPDQALGWNDLVEGGVAIDVIPGDHYAMIRPPQVQLLAEQLSACIEAATACEDHREA